MYLGPPSVCLGMHATDRFEALDIAFDAIERRFDECERRLVSWMFVFWAANVATTVAMIQLLR